MKAIILAAWKGTRLQPLTNTIPKSMIQIMGKPILEYTIQAIHKECEEIIIVVDYLKESIINYFWDKYSKTKITYIKQSEKKPWTGGALMDIKAFEDDFLVINWDTIFDEKDISKLIKSKHYWALVKEVENPQIYWIFKCDEDNFASKIVEKPKTNIWNLANLWLYKFSSDFLSHVQKIKKSARWEYEITDAVASYIKENKFKLFEIKGDFIDIWYPWDILKANKYLLNNLKKSNIKWVIEKQATIKWNIILEKWAIIKNWAYIEWNVYIWKNSIIWPNCYIRWETVIWKDCKVWNAVEIKNSNLGNNTKVSHLSYIGDSVLWNNVNIWAWFISANLRHDKNNIKVMIKWELVDSGMHKLWIIIWDNSKTWVKSQSYPWRVLNNDIFTMPWEIIK